MNAPSESSSFPTRRIVLAAGVVAIIAVVAGVFYWRQSPDTAPSSTASAVTTPSPLGDMALGPADAKVTIIEYASMSCPHCAAFTNDVFPKLKSEYIDTGKIRFIFREFPLNQEAVPGAMIARCIGKDDPNKFFAVIDAVFKQQPDWLRTGFVVDGIKRIASQAGMSEQEFEACFKNEKIFSGIKTVQEHAFNTLKVNSTPSFFINGTLVTGEQSFEEFKKRIDPLL